MSGSGRRAARQTRRPAADDIRSMAETMVASWLRQGSGILTAMRGKLKRLFCFVDGPLVFVASNVVEEQLGAFAVRAGLLTAADLAAYEREARERGVKTTALIAELKAIAPSDLERLLRERIRTLASDTLEWGGGQLRFDRGRPNLDGEIQVRVSPVELLVEHARAHPFSPDALRARVGRPDLRLELRGQRLEQLGKLALGFDVDALLARCASAGTLGELLGACADDLENTLRAVYALRLLGVLQTGGEAEPSEVVAERPLTREEALARITKADGADHYEVLGLARGAALGEIRSAYYQLARRMHPDRFRTGELQDLLEPIERYFTQVTEAYNTLSDRELRKIYDDELEEASSAKSREAAESDTSFLARQNFLRGQALVQSRRYNEALQFLQNAVDLDGTQARYFLALGLLQSRNPRLRAEAEANLTRVTEIEPTAIVAYLSLGNLYQRAERTAEAAGMYREALRWDPDNREAHEALASLGGA